MQKPTLGWQSWSPPYSAWHGLPRWDYSPFPHNYDQKKLKSSRGIKNKIVYWCSWYAHDTRINDQIIKSTLSIIKKNNLPLTHILIDDGWTTWGDWLNPDLSKFPDLKKTITNIHQAGYKVGLWFAPFLADRSSQLYQSHPDWFVQYKKGPVQGLKTMPIWESLISQRYILNFSLPVVQELTKKYLKQAIVDWKIDLLKLDFLYAPYFDPNHTSPQIPARHLKWLLSHLKNNYPSVQTIACGAPFKDSSYLVDAIRVSKDTALPPFVPHLINKIVYQNRIKMVKESLKSEFSPNLNLDPDVRMFSLDTVTTSEFWGSINTSILGVGDNLLIASPSTQKAISSWIKKATQL